MPTQAPPPSRHADTAAGIDINPLTTSLPQAGPGVPQMLRKERFTSILAACHADTATRRRLTAPRLARLPPQTLPPTRHAGKVPAAPLTASQPQAGAYAPQLGHDVVEGGPLVGVGAGAAAGGERG